MNKSYVYFMHAVETSFYKIGWTTTNLKTRLDNVQICCPFEVKIVCLIETDEPKITERRLHERFAQYRSRGEWFNLDITTVGELFWSYQNGVILDQEQIQKILADARLRVLSKLANRRRAKEGKQPLPVKLVRFCQNPECEKRLTGKQRKACSRACSQKLYRIRQAAA